MRRASQSAAVLSSRGRANGGPSLATAVLGQPDAGRDLEGGGEYSAGVLSSGVSVFTMTRFTHQGKNCNAEITYSRKGPSFSDCQKMTFSKGIDFPGSCLLRLFPEG